MIKAIQGKIGLIVLAVAVVVIGLWAIMPRSNPDANKDVVIGLVAPLSGGSATAGESIERGLQIAIDDVNANGGVLGGRKLRLVVRDDAGDPARGAAVARELVEREHAVAIFGGLHSPVSLALKPIIQELKVPYIGTWAAATGITVNDQNPNFMFRVSARDDLVDQFLVDHLSSVGNCDRPGLILENTPWGESNQTGLAASLAEKQLKSVGVEKFNTGDVDMSPQLLRLKNAGAKCLILVANAPEGAQVVRSGVKIGWKVPIISHWGISGGRFPELAGPEGGSVRFFQTFSFFSSKRPALEHVMQLLKSRYKIGSPAEIHAPVGTANAYDALHLLAVALNEGKSDDGARLRSALENVSGYDGLIKTYDHPFSATNHDALGKDDYILVTWQNGRITPVGE